MRCASRAANGPDHLGLCRRVLLDSYMKKAFENNDVFSSDRFRRFLKPGGEEGDGGLGVGCEGALVLSAVLPLPSFSEGTASPRAFCCASAAFRLRGHCFSKGILLCFRCLPSPRQCLTVRSLPPGTSTPATSA